MKKSIISIVADRRRPYDKPDTMVFLSKNEPTMITGSDKKRELDIIEDEEEDWPSDPGTGKPLSPW